LGLDEDVIAEEQRLDMNAAGDGRRTGRVSDAEALLRQDEEEEGKEVIRVHNFRKVYTKLIGSPFLAVERISFGL
jgi:hypothetical protein